MLVLCRPNSLCALTRPFVPHAARPPQRPQMVVVENPPTLDDEGKMVCLLPHSVAHRTARSHSLGRVQVSNMAVGVAQKP